MRRPILSAFAALFLAGTPLAGPGTWLAPSQALAQATLTFENIGFGGELGRIAIPRIVIEGATATRAEIEGLFDPSRAATAAERFRAMSARSVSIPSIELRQKTPDGESVTTYRDVTLTNIRAGVVAELLIPLTTGTARVAPAAGAPRDIETRAVEQRVADIDVGLLLTALFTGGGRADEPLRPAIGEQTSGPIAIRSGDEVQVAIGGATARGFRLRVPQQPLVAMAQELARDGAGGSGERTRKAMGAAGALISAFAFDDLSISAVSGDFRQPGGERGSLSIERMTMAGETAIPSRFAIVGLRTEAAAGSLRLGEFSWEGLDVSGPLAALASGDIETEPERLVPKIGRIRVAGLDYRLPSSGSAKAVSGQLGLLDLRMSNHVGAVPADVSLRLDNLRFALPDDARDSGLKTLLSLGYRDLDVSGRYEQAWDRATKALRVTDLTIDSAGMFALSAKAELANVAAEIFSLNRATQAVAALGVSARRLEASLVNKGLAEKLLDQQAGATGRKPEDVRREMAAGAVMATHLFLGDTPAARVVGQALGKFIAEPKNMRLRATAKEGGIGALDFMAARDPRDLLGRIDVEAAANE